MQPLSADTLLMAWERGRSRHPVDRALLLFSLGTSEADPNALADVSLGQRNATLLKLRQATFGNRLRAYLDCPACRERLEFDMDVSNFLASAPNLPEAKTLIEVDGLRFRPPTSRDMACIAQERDVETAALALLGQCLVQEGSVGLSAETSLASYMDQVEAALEQADPWADLVLDFRCEVCGYAGTASFDIAAFLWDEIDSRAQGLLDEVHLLARAYGWREADILALSEARRAAYLERARP